MNATQIIQRSINATPNEFRAALIAQAEMHDDYASSEGISERARQGAIASRRACNRAAWGITQGDAATIVADCGTMVVALNVACKLQELAAHVRTAAAVAWQDHVSSSTQIQGFTN